LSGFTYTITDATGKTRVWRGAAAVKKTNFAVYRITERHTLLRLTGPQLNELDDALSPHDLNEGIIQQIEDALEYFRFRLKTRRKHDRRAILRSQRKRLAAALALRPYLGALGEPVEKPLETFVRELSAEVASYEREPHRSQDKERLVLAMSAVWALDDSQIPIVTGRDTVAVRVIRLDSKSIPRQLAPAYQLVHKSKPRDKK
jgi:hypothetical protein